MSSKLEELKPPLIWKHFSEFLKIPHCSGNEKALGDYIISVAKRNELEWQWDKAGNVIVNKKASPGFESSEGIILQGHLDMVCEKNSDTKHDFSKDEIQAKIDGEWVIATTGTTLGADNGIGGCAALAIMEDNGLKHPPLEFLFTVEEETGLIGASKLQPGFLKGRKLLNLDSEDEGEFTIGCAGGADTQIVLPVKQSSKESNDLCRIRLFGFQGGHSGMDIHLGRGNPIKLLARILWETAKEVPFQLTEFEGGTLRNAIPREAWANILIGQDNKDRFESLTQKSFEFIKNEYKVTEPEAQMSFAKSKEGPRNPLDKDSHSSLVNLLYSLPHGVIAMHPEMEGLVETSTNLAIVHTHEDNIQVICNTRSSTASALEATRHSLEAASELAGARTTLEEGYPGWKPNLQSPLLKKLKEIYQETFGNEPHVVAVHGGLECGIIGEKFPGMDMISFGPTIRYPHSPNEKVHIKSVEKFWAFLTTLLSELK